MSKLWLVGSYDEFVGTTIQQQDNDGLNISWCSSNSDSDENQFTAKRFKSKHSSSCTDRWINLGHSFNQPSILRASISDSLNDTCLSINTGFTQLSCQDIDRFDAKPSSPIINTTKFEELSPVLSGSQSKDSLCLSPVIGKKSVRTKKRRRSHPTVIIENESVFTPELESTIFSSQHSDDTLTESYSIDQIVSQQLTQTLFSNSSTSQKYQTDTAYTDKLLHRIPHKKRKKYKKGGLAYLVQKAVAKQRTNFEIWQHELYLQKLNELSINFIDERTALLLSIIRFWKEFGVTLIICKRIGNYPSCDNVFQSLDTKKCMVIIGFNITYSLSLESNKNIKLFRPYCSKIIEYNKESIMCYFNISKVILAN